MDAPKPDGSAPPAPREHVPFIPASTVLPELTLKALGFGIVMAALFGAANAYLGLIAGQTNSATFPAAVLAIAAGRLPGLSMNVLEQNLARSSAAVGEALVAGAIFTIPAFVLVSMNGERLWTRFNYWETSIILAVGGLLGVLFVILLRRTLVVEADLPFPESYAAYEIVRAGQGGMSGAGFIFGGLGVGALLQLLKSSSGFQVFRESAEFFVRFPASVTRHFTSERVPLGEIAHGGGVAFSTPSASPALMGVGFIIGPRLAAINFSGGLLAWLVFIPLGLFLNPGLGASLAAGGAPPPLEEQAFTVWYNQVRPMAVGAMLVGSLWTLWGLRRSIGGAFRAAFRRAGGGAAAPDRLERDIDLRWIVGGVARALVSGSRPDADIDIAVEGDLEPVLAALGLPARRHDRFGTAVVALGDGRHADIARTRTESYAHHDQHACGGADERRAQGRHGSAAGGRSSRPARAGRGRRRSRRRLARETRRTRQRRRAGPGGRRHRETVAGHPALRAEEWLIREERR